WLLEHLFVHDFQGHRAADRRLHRLVDRAHSPLADQVQQFVAAEIEGTFAGKQPLRLPFGNPPRIDHAGGERRRLLFGPVPNFSQLLGREKLTLLDELQPALNRRNWHGRRRWMTRWNEETARSIISQTHSS